MISKTDLAGVTEFKSAPGRVLSVYLDVDQSHVENLNRKFELAFESLIKETGRSFEEEYEERDFNGCVSEVRKVLRAYEPRARGLVIFVRSTGAIWSRELNIPVSAEVFWGPKAHVQQFLEAVGEFETYGVVVTDRSRSRVFTVKLGVLEKHAEIHAVKADVRHSKTAGTDHLYSQQHLQRKADEHALSHLKRVVELLEHASKFHPFDRLILAGATDATSELFRLLPKAFRRKVIASPSLSANATDGQIVEEVMFIGRKAERAHELETAEVLITASAKKNHGVTSLAPTLAALNANRVRDLVYSPATAFCGGVCEPCDAVFPNDMMNCDFCGLPVKPAEDLIEAILAKSLAEGATIEQVRGEAAEKLNAAGGIGAFLRY
jgi:peptide subunit release factor 1 (eRF1)